MEKDHPSYDRWKKDFEAFSNTESIAPPPDLSVALREKISARLAPSKSLIFGKLFGLQLVVAVLTVWICPQFGVPSREAWGIFDWVHHYSPSVCLAACGAFFVGLNSLVATLILEWDELRVLGRLRIPYFSALGFIFLGLFHLVSGEVLPGGAAAWLAGALAGGIALYTTGRKLRTAVLKA